MSRALRIALVTLTTLVASAPTAQTVRDSIPVEITFHIWRSWSGGTYRNCGSVAVGVHDDPIGRGIGTGSYSYTRATRDSDAESYLPDIPGVRVTYRAGSSSASSPGRWPNCGGISSRHRAAWAGIDPIWAVYSLPQERPIAKFTWKAQGRTVYLDGTPSRIVTAEGPRPVSSYEWSLGGSGAALAYTFEEAGDYEVSLTVTDDEGETDTYTETVTVAAHQLAVRALPVEPDKRYTIGETVVIETMVENTGTEPVLNVVVPAYTEMIAAPVEAPAGASDTRNASARRIDERGPETRASLAVGAAVAVRDSFRVESLGEYRLDGVWHEADVEAWGLLTGAVEAEPSVAGDTVQVVRPCDEGECEIVIIGPERFAVTTTGDEPDPNLADDVCDVDVSADGLQCTLRAAIQNVNDGNEQPIWFDIEGAGPHTIAVASPLPAVTVPTEIDGTTQPGYAGRPLIVLDGSGVGNADGLVLAAETTVRGLAVVDFGGAGIRLAGTGGHTVEQSHLGVSSDGTTLRANRYGILVDDTAGNTVGGTSGSSRNLIGASLSDDGESFQDRPAGVLVRGSMGENVVAGNWIGLRATGDAPLAPTRRGIGVLVVGGPGTVVGGATDTPGTAPGNVIGGLDYGIAVTSGADDEQAVGIRIDGNLVGTDATGVRAVGNSTGIGVVGLAERVEIGTGAGNVVSGNETAGIAVQTVRATTPGEKPPGPALTRIVGNTIGLTADGQSLLGNEGFGVAVLSDLDEIGDLMPGPLSTQIGASGAPRNLIAGNGIQVFISGGAHAVYSDPDATDEEVLQTYTFVESNYIGLLADGTQPRTPSTEGPPANVVGVLVGGEARARIGTGGAPNVIGGQSSGVVIEGAGSAVSSNLIGTDPTGTESRPNTIGVATSSRFTVIGPVPGSGGTGNVISGNLEAGVYITGAAAEDISALRGLAEFNLPLNHTLRADSTASPSSQSRSAQTAPVPPIDLPDVVGVFGNRIGVGADGAALPNGVTLLGGRPPFEAGGGVLIVRATAIIAENVISGNAGDGVAAYDADVSLVGNVIGGAGDPEVARPNTRDGVYVRSSRVTVGVPVKETGSIPALAAPSTSQIRFNGRHGVGAAFANDDLFVREASFHANGGLGIATGLLDADAGLLPPAAFLPAVDASGAPPTLRFRSQTPDVSIANLEAQMVLGFYLSDECDPSGFGEGLARFDERLAQPNETFDYELTSDAVDLSLGRYLTMTAAQVWMSDGEEVYQTSPFSACARLADAADTARAPISAAGDGLSGPGIDVTVRSIGTGRQVAARGGSAADTLYVARYALLPDSSSFKGMAQAPNGSVVSPDSVAARYWALSALGLDGVTYDACLDIDGLFPEAPSGSLLIVRRERARAPWSPVSSTLIGGRLCATDLVGFGHLGVGARTGPATASEFEPVLEALALGTPYPNPARATSATVRVALPAASVVHVALYDALGRRVATAHDGPLAAGRHDIPIAVGGLPSGVYLVRLTTGTLSAVKRLTVAR